MEGDDCSFPDSSGDHSQRGSVASSATLSRAQDVLVYLFGESAVHLTLEGLGTVTVQELGQSVREALHIPDSAREVFAFWLCSPLLDLQLKLRHQPYKLCRQWQDLLYRFTDASEEDISQDEPYLQFRRNVFYPKSKEQQIEDEAVLRLLYDEAKSNILAGRYPCDPEHWTDLGALSFALDEGTGLDDQQFATVLKEKKVSSYVPAHVAIGSGGLFSTLRGKSSRQAGVEQNLLAAYRKLCTSVGDSPEPTQLLHQYLHTCHTLPYYGCALFLGEIDKPSQGILQRGKRKTVNVGICLEGVYVMDAKEKHVLLGLQFSELSWDHSYPEEEGDSHILWLEFDGEEDGTAVNKLLKIYSKQAELMSGFIEFCVELNSASEGGAAGETDREDVPQSCQSGRQAQEWTRRTARDASQTKQRGMQSSPHAKHHQLRGHWKRNQALEAQESCILFYPAGTRVLGCTSVRESGTGLNSSNPQQHRPNLIILH
ncbi:hypothetical protein fugu_009312 [Takifugu bimaculatus]|uniref:FERM domain-containing protein 8 n=1 Tax=Takifugu bimaculatus TaxID=433685 RepID=A0A4Z2AYH1_9TELE|nr:hypothetical protein fugu_009312 [Takifugu bimaculatus]